MRKRRVDRASRPDADNPEWTRAELASARPALAVLPAYIGAEATAALTRAGPGRPRKPTRKINQTLRLDPDVLAAYRQLGKGWQTRINQILRDNMPDAPSRPA
jgi:uncharacterized protein (DUF4415 family)